MGCSTEGRGAGPRGIGVGSGRRSARGRRARLAKGASWGGARRIVGGAWTGLCGVGVGSSAWGRGCGRGRPIRAASWTLGASAGPRPLTVATRYCRVPQSRTARLKRISRYYKEEPRARGHLERPHSGARGFWVLHPPSWLLPARRRPAPHSCPRGRGGAEGSRQAASPVYPHTLVHTRHPRACACRVCPQDGTTSVYRVAPHTPTRV